MSADSFGPPPDAHPVMPPMTPGAQGFAVPEAKSSWPTIIGVIAIVFGSGGMLTGCLSMVMPWVMPMITRFIESLPGANNANTMDMTQLQSPTSAVVIGLVTLGVALLLLLGGIALVKRRPNSARLCRWWAVLKMVFVVCNSAVVYSTMTATMQKAMSDAMTQGGGTAPVPVETIVEITMIVTIVLSVLWGWALPVFLLIWFSRRKVKAEVAEWTLNSSRHSSGMASGMGA